MSDPLGIEWEPKELAFQLILTLTLCSEGLRLGDGSKVIP